MMYKASKKKEKNRQVICPNDWKTYVYGVAIKYNLAYHEEGVHKR